MVYYIELALLIMLPHSDPPQKPLGGGGVTAAFLDHVIAYICRTKQDTANVPNKHE